MKNGSSRVGVVMAGGYGERFWPLSRPERPKQLLKLTHPKQNMLEQAIGRLEPLVSEMYVSTSRLLGPAIEGSKILPADRLLCEPARRGTLGALCWTVAGLIALGRENATVAVVTADHSIGDVSGFRESVKAAFTVAEAAGGFVTLGIRPTRPETGYGYIEIDALKSIRLKSGATAYRSSAFLEKPNAEMAVDFMTSGRHLWNGGMFFFKVSEFMSELERAQPQAFEITNRVVAALKAGKPAEADRAFEELPDESIDKAVMEKAETLHVIPVEFPWDDVGAWDALARTLESDQDGNVTLGPSHLLDVRSSVVVNDDPTRIVAVLGLEDVVVVNTHDAVLVCHKSEAQRVKQLLAKVQGK